MLATPGAPPAGPGWVIEPKFDGARCLARMGSGRTELFSRRANHLTASFPDVVAACSALAGRDIIVDGEIVVLDRCGRPNFGLLQRRLGVQRPPTSIQTALRATYVMWDVLHLDGRDLTGRPYRERRGVLESLCVDSLAPQLATCPAWSDVDGAAVLDAMAQTGMEGTVAKSATSLYQAGRRSRHWVKTPCQRSGYVAVGGFTGSRAARAVGALLVGAYDAAGDFVYAGTITAGFSHKARRNLYTLLCAARCDRSPFSGNLSVGPAVRWVWPVLVGRVEYRQYTRVLRHASWKGMTDVDPARAVLDGLR